MYEDFGNRRIFEDREDAGRQLAQLLTEYRDQEPVVLALPRGGVIVGYEIARTLRAPMDVVIARKLGAPGRPELGIGAIAPGGVHVLDQRAIQFLGITQEELAAVEEAETREMERRERLYRGDRPPVPVKGRTAIVVDDGLATGVSARAAIRSVQEREPRAVVLAVPVCAYESAQALRAEGVRVVCALCPMEFLAVGYWYRNFEQTTDVEVIATLDRARQQYAGEQGRAHLAPEEDDMQGEDHGRKAA